MEAALRKGKLNRIMICKIFRQLKQFCLSSFFSRTFVEVNRNEFVVSWLATKFVSPEDCLKFIKQEKQKDPKKQVSVLCKQRQVKKSSKKIQRRNAEKSFDMHSGLGQDDEELLKSACSKALLAEKSVSLQQIVWKPHSKSGALTFDAREGVANRKVRGFLFDRYEPQKRHELVSVFLNIFGYSPQFPTQLVSVPYILNLEAERKEGEASQTEGAEQKKEAEPVDSGIVCNTEKQVVIIEAPGRTLMDFLADETLIQSFGIDRALRKIYQQLFSAISLMHKNQYCKLQVL